MLPAPLRGSPPNNPPSNIEGKEGHERRERETKERQREVMVREVICGGATKSEVITVYYKH